LYSERAPAPAVDIREEGSWGWGAEESVKRVASKDRWGDDVRV